MKSSSNQNVNGIFCWSATDTKTNHTNSHIEITICGCGDEAIGESIDYIYYGNVSFISNNISKNKGADDVIFYSNSVSYYNTIQYNTFSENKSPNQCSYFYSGIQCRISKCNFVDNDSQNQYIFWNNDQLIFDECCILRNRAGSMFFKIDNPGSISMNRCNNYCSN